jgi:hypothetical protein
MTGFEKSWSHTIMTIIGWLSSEWISNATENGVVKSGVGGRYVTTRAGV